MLRSGLDLCLLALLENQTIYGYELTQRLAEQGLPVAGGSSYPLLARLERQGLLTTELRPSTAGPPRKYYSLSQLGRQALATGRVEWMNTVEAMSALLRPGQRASTTTAATAPSTSSAVLATGTADATR